MDYETASEHLRAARFQWHCTGGVSETLILAAEQALRVSFPPDYRQMLSEFGYVSLPGYEVYGILGPPGASQAGPDVVNLTQSYRRDAGLPPSYVVIGDADDGTVWVLACGGPWRGSVREFYPGYPIANQPWTLLAPTFADHLHELIRAVEEGNSGKQRR